MGSIARLYGVETKQFNQAVKRTIERFPSDFMFQCNVSELDDLRRQIGTSNTLIDWNHMRRSPPMLPSKRKRIGLISGLKKSSKKIYRK